MFMDLRITYRKTIKNCLNYAINEIKNISQSPELDAEILLANAIKKEKEYLYTYPEKNLTVPQIKKFQQMISRRKKYEPIAYIIGYKEFYGLKFKVNARALIPRPETEMLVEETLNIMNNISPCSAILIDIGTGSGCIPIAIAKNIKNTRVKICAIDISKKTLKIAKSNAKLNNAEIKFLQGSLLEPLKKITKNNNLKNLIITANLPYLPTAVYNRAMPDIKLYEPKNALAAGKDGLKYYRELFKQIKKNLPYLSNFHILCEIDQSQKNSMAELAGKYFPNIKTQTKKDLAGLDRLFIAERKGG